MAHKKQLLSATTMIDNKVVNKNKEEVGSIEELMIDIDTGCIVYGVLSFGGFIGLGDSLFAIPWDSLFLDMDEKCFILNIDPKTLKNEQGFDKNDWPDMGDLKWEESNKKLFKTQDNA